MKKLITILIGLLLITSVFSQTKVNKRIMLDSLQNKISAAEARQNINDSLNVNSNHLLREIRALGSDAKALPIGASQVLQASATLQDGVAYYSAFYLPNAITITGVKFIQIVQGSYTADEYNGIGLYSLSGTTMTKITETVNNGNIWKGSGYSLQTVAFPSQQVLSPGVYYLGFVYNTSSQITAPSMQHWNLTGGTSQIVTGNRVSGTVATQITLPTTQVMSGLTTALYVYGPYMY